MVVYSLTLVLIALSLLCYIIYNIIIAINPLFFYEDTPLSYLVAYILFIVYGLLIVFSISSIIIFAISII